MEEELDIVTFTDEEGNEYDLEAIDYFSYEDEMYALLVDPASTEDEDAEVEVYIMKAVTEGDETTFMPADDDKMDALSAIAEQHLDVMAADLEARSECECGCGCTHEDCGHDGCDCEHDDCGCGHHIEDKEYDGGKPGFCSGE